MSFIAESFAVVQPIASQQLIRLNINYSDMMGVKLLPVSEQLTQLHEGK
jgi:hypothetical protein